MIFYDIYCFTYPANNFKSYHKKNSYNIFVSIGKYVFFYSTFFFYKTLLNILNIIYMIINIISPANIFTDPITKMSNMSNF